MAVVEPSLNYRLNQEVLTGFSVETAIEIKVEVVLRKSKRVTDHAFRVIGRVVIAMRQLPLFHLNHVTPLICVASTVSKDQKSR